MLSGLSKNGATRCPCAQFHRPRHGRAVLRRHVARSCRGGRRAGPYGAGSVAYQGVRVVHSGAVPGVTVAPGPGPRKDPGRHEANRSRYAMLHGRSEAADRYAPGRDGKYPIGGPSAADPRLRSSAERGRSGQAGQPVVRAERAPRVVRRGAGVARDGSWELCLAGGRCGDAYRCAERALLAGTHQPGERPDRRPPPDVRCRPGPPVAARSGQATAARARGAGTSPRRP